MNDFDRELESELHRMLDPLRAMPLPPRRRPQRRSSTRTVLGGASAALAFKLVSGAAVAATALTVAGAATTGSVNPAAWGEQVTRHVNMIVNPQSPAPAQKSPAGGSGVTSNQKPGGGNDHVAPVPGHASGPAQTAPGKADSKDGLSSDSAEPTDPAMHPPVGIRPGP